jgi:hypothetical protein
VGLMTDIVTGRRTKGGFTNYVREIFYHFWTPKALFIMSKQWVILEMADFIL